MSSPVSPSPAFSASGSTPVGLARRATAFGSRRDLKAAAQAGQVQGPNASAIVAASEGKFLPSDGSVVVDLGARLTKVGVVGEVAARRVFRTPRAVCEALRSGRSAEEIEKACYHFLSEELIIAHNLRTSPHPVALLVNPAANSDFYSYLTDLVVRCTGKPVFQISPQVGSLWCAGATSGLVIDVGYTCTRCVPILHGRELTHAVTFSKVGACSVLQSIKAKMLQDSPAIQSDAFQSSISEEAIEEALFQYGVVAPPNGELPEEERNAWLNQGYPFHIKTQTVPIRPILALEPLFVEVGGEDSGCPPLPLLACRSLLKCDVVSRSQVANTILVRGGISEVENFDARFAKELLHLVKTNSDLRCMEPLLATTKMPARTVIGGAVTGIAGVMIRFRAEKDQ